jgi:hypothetical protein
VLFDDATLPDDFGRSGRVYRETDENEVDRETVIRHIINGHYEKPVRVVAFNTAEGWSRDVTKDIGREILERAARKAERMSHSAQSFVEWATGDDVPLGLRAEA